MHKSIRKNEEKRNSFHSSVYWHFLLYILDITYCETFFMPEYFKKLYY